MAGFDVCVLGVSSAIPAFGRHPTAQVLGYNDRYFLLDCGEGTQFQLSRYRIRVNRLDAVFISHLHGDHILGLPGLLTTLAINLRTEPLSIYGPVGIRAFIEQQFALCGTQLRYPLVWNELNLEQPAPIADTKYLKVWAAPLIHQVSCLAYAFQEHPRKPPFLITNAHRLGVPTEFYHLLKQGVDVELRDGRVIRASEVLGPVPPSRCYLYCTDTVPVPQTLAQLPKPDLLYHEATFLQHDAQRARETWHSTAQQAAEVAQTLSADRLLLGHFSARYKTLQGHLDESRAVFPATELAEEGGIYAI